MQISIDVVKSATRRRSLSMHILGKNEIQLRAPARIGVNPIIDFVVQNTRFLRKALKAPVHVALTRQLSTGDVLMIFGKQYLVEVRESSRVSVKIDHENEAIVAKAPNSILPLKKFYTKISGVLDEYCAPKCTEIAPRMSTILPKLVRYKLTRSLWGSCTTTRNITLNKRLIHYPKEVIDYVIVHELAHLQEHNHSERFWNIVKDYCPDFKQMKQILKAREYG